MKKFSITLLKIVILIFALIGFLLLSAYFGVNLHLTNTSGFIDSQSDVFWKNGKTLGQGTSTPDAFFTIGNYCAMQKIKAEYPGTFLRVLGLAVEGKATLAQNNLNVAVENVDSPGSCTGIQPSAVTQKDFEILGNSVDAKNSFVLGDSAEWTTFKTAVLKDTSAIRKAESVTGIKGRMLVAMLVSEQMRVFYSDRAWFETALSPIKVLVTMSQFSWGVLGIKEETALQIEENLKDSSSAFYVGPDFVHALDFTGTDVSTERFTRLTNYHDHYYGYLYAGMYAKEVIAQWQKSGFDVSDRPEILATLYNIGFVHSVPNPNPQIGGAAITINGKQYSFGRLAYDFYYSGELLNEFPQ